MTVEAGSGVKGLVEAAYTSIQTLEVDEALSLYGRDDVQFVDVRDVRELAREGRIPGAFHMPRGMTEFWVDPGSPYFKSLFEEPRRFVFFCARGWRSALSVKSAMDMGLKDVCHFEGGFGAWKEAGGAVDRSER